MKDYMNDEKLRAKLCVIKSLIDGKMTTAEAASRLHLSGREIYNLKAMVIAGGDKALLHGNAGRRPANYKPDDIRQRIIELKKSENYKAANVRDFWLWLGKRENISVCYETVRTILTAAAKTDKDINLPKKRKKRKKQHHSRDRRSQFGDLLQGDASKFQWFKLTGDNDYYNLHGFIDDSRGIITGLRFEKNECLMGYLEVLRQTLEAYGIPNEMYLDKIGIFFVNNKKKENWTIEEQLAGKCLNKTQFGRITEIILGTHLIPANTPEAKGRIEALWRTLQGRLPTWFKINGITNMEQANNELPRYIKEFNDEFAINPESEASAFVPLPANLNLDFLLAARYDRVTDNCGCFSFQNFTFQIETDKPYAKRKVQFVFSERIGFMACLNRQYYPAKLIGVTKGRCKTHMPDVTKMLMQKQFYTDGKRNPPPMLK
jgi:hypothetical protein